jgi:hypothetical protein
MTRTTSSNQIKLNGERERSPRIKLGYDIPSTAKPSSIYNLKRKAHGWAHSSGTISRMSKPVTSNSTAASTV